MGLEGPYENVVVTGGWTESMHIRSSTGTLLFISDLRVSTSLYMRISKGIGSDGAMYRTITVSSDSSKHPEPHSGPFPRHNRTTRRPNR